MNDEVNVAQVIALMEVAFKKWPGATYAEQLARAEFVYNKLQRLDRLDHGP